MPWDRVLYECEPAYAHFRPNRANQDTLDLISEAQQIRRFRKQAGLTQAALAEKAGMARPNLARIEAGRYRPALETLERIASALGYSVSMLVSAQTIPHKERQQKTSRKRKAA